MIGSMYSVQDVKGEAFGLPFVAVSDVVAQRQVAAAMQDGAVMWRKFPEDFRLFRVGHFDDSTGQVAAEWPPVLVCDLVKLKGD